MIRSSVIVFLGWFTGEPKQSVTINLWIQTRPGEGGVRCENVEWLGRGGWVKVIINDKKKRFWSCQSNYYNFF